MECIIKTTLSWICTLHTQDTKKRQNYKSNTQVLVWPKIHENAHFRMPWRGLLLTQQDDNVQSLEHVTTDIKEHYRAHKEFLILFGGNSNSTNYQLFELEVNATNTIVRVLIPYQKQWDTTNKSKWTWIGSRRVRVSYNKRIGSNDFRRANENWIMTDCRRISTLERRYKRNAYAPTKMQELL